MRISKVSNLAAAAIVAAAFLCPAVSNAQGNTNGPNSNSLSNLDANQANHSITEMYMTQTQGDPKEAAAYDAFHKLDATQADKKIKLGDTYLAKYPKGRYSQAVYEE